MTEDGPREADADPDPDPIPPPPQRSAAPSVAELQACVRDLMSLIALPAMTSSSDPHAILRRFCEALETLLPLQFCVATAPPFDAAAPAPLELRVGGAPYTDTEDHWHSFVEGCEQVRGSDAVIALEATPCGLLRVVKLALGYGQDAGSLAVGAQRADFPSVTELAVLRAAASLAAGRLKAAQLVHEREQASRVKDEFLAMLGHELRNPLSPIVTALGLMKLRGDDKTLREQQIIARQTDHLIRLVDDLMDVSRVTRGKVELRSEWIEISAVLANAVEMASLLLEQRGHHLTVLVPAQGMLWQGDPTRLAQVVANLLTNAARYTDRGGQIALTAAREGAEVVIRVRDNGSGIAPDMLRTVFDMFVQGRRSIERAEGGLGLGLALVKSLVEMHGGRVAARSDGLGRGSEFVVFLPMPADAGPALAATSAPDMPTPAALTRKRVLLVDDNADGADSLAGILTASGHEVRVVYDPLTALQVCSAFAPDVAVLDIGLPVMDGYELAARLRALPALSGLQLIALTGYGRDHDSRKSERAGFGEHLVKPVAPARLLASIERLGRVQHPG